jgi:hypothetical protein
MRIKRIHIVGCGPRSGTTLLAELMRVSFKIDLYTSHEASMSTLPPEKGKIFLTKKPRDILVVEPILKLNPNLTVLYMIRDPRDMVVSKHGIAPDQYWSSLKYWKTYSAYGKKLEGHPRFITIRYESLVKDPDQIQNLIINRIPFLEKTQNFSEFSSNNQVSIGSKKALGSVRKISSNSIGVWKNHLPRIKDQLKKHGSISQDLIDYGYEPNKDWERILMNVEDINFQSYRDEYFSRQTLKKRHSRKKLKAIWVFIGHSNIFLFFKHIFKK